jgi:hypothetical protein
MPKPRGGTSYRFSSEAQELLARLADALGVSKTAVIEMALRKVARAELPAEQIPAESEPARRGRPPKATPATPPAKQVPQLVAEPNEAEAKTKKPRKRKKK